LDTQEFQKTFITENRDDAGIVWRGPVINTDTLENAELILEQMKTKLLVPPSTTIIGYYVDSFIFPDA